jgi:hypothetical protein
MAKSKSESKRSGGTAKSGGSGRASLTTDHDVIREWAEKRGGCPSSVEGTAAEHEAGLLRLDFKPDDEKLEDISWDDFFEKFEEANLAFLYQEHTADGKISRFHKFIDRSSAKQDDE